MKKLLWITWSVSYGYGTERSLADVLNRLDETAYESSVLPLFKKSDSHIFKEHIRVLPPLIDYTQENFQERSALQRYYQLLASPVQFNQWLGESYDCVIACNHNAPSYFASYLTAGARLLWIRGDMRELDASLLPPDSPERPQVEREYAMQAGVLKRFDGIAVISDTVGRALERLFGITERVYRIPNSVDRERLERLSREKVDLPRLPLFTSLGRLDENKNQILLLRAAKLVKQRRSDFLIYLLGEGEERPALERYIRENGLEQNVKLLGFTENPYPYLKHSAATVLTSRSEGFSLALVESAALNTPFISTDVGVARELAQRCGCGDIIDYDEKELAAILLRYLTSYDGTKRPIELGGAYSLDAEVAQTTALIDRTLRQAEAKAQGKRLPYPEVTIRDSELADYQPQRDAPYVLRVLRQGVPYEYLIHWRSESRKLIVFHNGAVPGGNVTAPVFQRHSWAEDLKTSCVFCMDPTLYENGCLQLGWGVGKNGDHYLEHSSKILRTLIDKMGVALTDTVLYGTSAGGYLSILMGTFLPGAAVVADNAQLDLRDWVYPDALDGVLTFCFDHLGDALRYPERFSAIDAFLARGYVPPLYLHVNLCSTADNSTQLVPFLRRLETLDRPLDCRNIQVILHYEPEKGHDGLSKEETIAFLYKVLGVQ